MSFNEIDINQYSKNRAKSEFSNNYNINISSLTIFPPVKDCFIQFSPNNEYMAFVQNNIFKIFKKMNNNWEENFSIKIPFEKKTIKGINWSLDNKLFLIYGDDNNEIKSLIKVFNLDNPTWECDLEINDYINHASFYPNSKSIVYIKKYIKSLNIFSLVEQGKNQKNKSILNKHEYFFIKFDDNRSVNYIENNNNLFMILPCFGRTKLERDDKINNPDPKDYIIILVNKQVHKCFNPPTQDLERIVPLRNRFSFFIAVEKEFYKHPFYIYNLNGEVMFKSEFDKQLLINPCLLNNKNHETNFLIVQEPKEGKLDVFGCQIYPSKTDVYFYYDYNKLYENIEKIQKIPEKNKNYYFYGRSKNNNNNSNNNWSIPKDDIYYTIKDDILFLEEQIIYHKTKSENIMNNGINIDNNKNPFRKLIKVDPFEIEKSNTKDDDYQLHAEVSPIKNYICFMNKNHPKYLFFGCYYQIGVFKIIKFINNILAFKWSSQQDILLVTFDSGSYLYFITKDNYLSYNLNEKEYYNFDDIEWSSSGKDIIISNKEKNIKLVASLL